jgi:hypothetical protein
MRVARRLFLAIALAAPTPLVAQQADPLLPGARIRYQLVATPERRTALVLERAGDTVVVGRQGESPRRFPVWSMADVQVSRGRSHAKGALRGLMWGLGLGVGLPTAYYIAIGAPGDQRDDWAFASLLYGTMASMITVPVGAIIGVERWHPAAVGAPRVGVLRAHDGVRMTLAWSR